MRVWAVEQGGHRSEEGQTAGSIGRDPRDTGIKSGKEGPGEEKGL